MIDPSVSVVMAVYNGGERLNSTLDSILAQTGVDFELIVVDDGSTDRTPEVLAGYAQRDPRIVVHRQTNAGLTRALIAGCTMARASFIARQDSGDLSLPGRLCHQWEVMASNPDLSFVSCVTRYATEAGEPLFFQRGTGRAKDPCRIIDLDQRYGVVDGPSCHPSVMFRRSSYSVMGGYRKEFYFGQDWDLWYRLAQVGLFQMLPDVLYEARFSSTDISMSSRARQEAIGQYSLQALRLRLEGRDEAPALAAAAQIRPSKGVNGRPKPDGRGDYFIGECLRRRGERRAALGYFGRAVQANPLLIKAWVRLAQAAMS